MSEESPKRILKRETSNIINQQHETLEVTDDPSLRKDVFFSESILNRNNPKIIIPQIHNIDSENNYTRPEGLDILGNEKTVGNEQLVIYVDLNTDLKQIDEDENYEENINKELNIGDARQKINEGKTVGTKQDLKHRDPENTLSDDHMKSVSNCSTNNAFMCEAYDSSDSKHSSIIDDTLSPITEGNEYKTNTNNIEHNIENNKKSIIDNKNDENEDNITYVQTDEKETKIVTYVSEVHSEVSPFMKKQASQIITGVDGSSDAKPGYTYPEGEMKAKMEELQLPIWMEKPLSFPDCPSGLEYLTKLDQIVVQQTGYVDARSEYGRTNFMIKNCAGQNIYSIFSNSELGCLPRFFCASHRRYEINIFDINKQEVIHITRTRHGNRRTVNISHPLSGEIGKVVETARQPPIFHVNDEHSKTLFVVEKLSNPRDGEQYYFSIKTADVNSLVGKIIMRNTNSIRRMSHTNQHVVHFQDSLSVKSKALLMGASMLIDFIFFEFM